MTTTAGLEAGCRNAERSARRRALAALADLERAASDIAARLTYPPAPDAAEARKLIEYAGRVTENMAMLEALRESREWWLAGQAESEAGQ
jgi:hypothetical protein